MKKRTPISRANFGPAVENWTYEKFVDFFSVRFPGEPVHEWAALMGKRLEVRDGPDLPMLPPVKKYGKRK